MCEDVSLSKFQLYLSRQNWVNHSESWLSFKSPIYSDPEDTYVIYSAQAATAASPIPSSGMAGQPSFSASKNAEDVICPQTSAQVPPWKVSPSWKPSRGLYQGHALTLAVGRTEENGRNCSNHANPLGWSRVIAPAVWIFQETAQSESANEEPPSPHKASLKYVFTLTHRFSPASLHLLLWAQSKFSLCSVTPCLALLFNSFCVYAWAELWAFKN